MAWSESQRGVGGGVTLTRRPAELTILEVVNAVEPIQRIKTCPLGLKTHGVRLCPLHRRMDDGPGDGRSGVRRDTTLAEVLAEPTQSPPLCEVGRRTGRSGQLSLAARYSLPPGPGLSCPHPPEAVPCDSHFSLLCLACLRLAPPSPAPFEFKSTDRVVLIGGTLIEREQRYGYWEAMLTARYPGIKVRNLGWSGDNVFGDARRAFDLDKPDIGRKRLVELTLAEKPTVILICYGTNEAFEGEAGLDKFKKGYEKLLDELAPTKARIVLMSPPPMEDKGRPLPDPAPQNKRLASTATRSSRSPRPARLYFADLFQVARRRPRRART